MEWAGAGLSKGGVDGGIPMLSNSPVSIQSIFGSIVVEYTLRTGAETSAFLEIQIVGELISQLTLSSIIARNT